MLLRSKHNLTLLAYTPCPETDLPKRTFYVPFDKQVAKVFTLDTVCRMGVPYTRKTN